MSRIRRVLCCALIAVGLLGVTAGPALAHATLLGATPGVNGRGVSEGQQSVALRFSEPVQILNRSDISVVNERGRQVDTGAAHTIQGNPEEVIIPLRGPLLPFSYTVRYRVVSSDSHAVSAAFVFGVGKAKLGDPILAGSGGLSDTSPPAVAARAVELTALGLLVGLIVFRLLVWGPAVAEAGGLSLADRASAMRNGRKTFWRAFWALVDPRRPRGDRRAGGQERRRLPHRADRRAGAPDGRLPARRGVALRRSPGLALRRAARARRDRVRRVERRDGRGAGGDRAALVARADGTLRARGADAPRRPGPRLAGAARAAVGRR